MTSIVASDTTRRRAKIGLVFAAIALALASLWDFRLYDVRAFDGAAVGCLIAYFTLSPEARTGFFERRRDYWLLFATIAAYAAFGYILHGHRSSLAMLTLSILGFILAGRRDWIASLGVLPWALVGAHALFFLTQFLAFYGFQVVIDYLAIFGETSRIMRSPEQMRAAGLFQEPNSYGLNLFVITTIAVLHRPSRPFTLIVGMTMFLSESLWGIGASIVLLLLNELRMRQSLRKLAIAFGAYFVVIMISFNAYLWLTKNPSESVPHLYERTAGLLTDGSLRERYLHNTCITAEPSGAFETSQTARLFLGQGLSTHFFRECLPANGFAFLLKSFGIIGLAALFSGFAVALRGLSWTAKCYAALAVFVSFTSYPLMTYLIFWLWVPTIFGLLRLTALEHAFHTARD